MTIVEFLNARLDEADARLQKVFSQMDRPHWPGCDYPGDMPGVCDCDLTEWLLADIAAKRAILALHHPDRHLENWYWLERECAECKHRWHKWLPEKPPTEIGPEQGCPTLRLLALPYADRPGYREEWE